MRHCELEAYDSDAASLFYKQSAKSGASLELALETLDAYVR
jgi:hypothetical protein